MNVLLLLLGAFLITSLAAEQRTCRIVYPDRPQDAPKSAFLFDGTRSHKVTLPSMSLSEVIQLPEGRITIALTTGEITDSKALLENAPTLLIPENTPDFYVVLTANEENPYLPIQMKLAYPEAGGFEVGQTLWLNLSNHQIVATLGDAKLSLEPLDMKISDSPSQKSEYYRAKFFYKKDAAGEFAPLAEQSWWHDSKSRSLGLILDSGGRLPKIMALRDFREAAGE